MSCGEPFRVQGLRESWGRGNNVKKYVLVVIGIVIAYLLLFAGLLWRVWPRLDPVATVGIVGVVGGGLAGVIGAAVAGMIGLWRAEKESEDRLKHYASMQALELTKLEYELRMPTGIKEHYAPAKVYREFYKALFELYATKSWPKDIEIMGLLNVLKYKVDENSEKTE